MVVYSSSDIDSAADASYQSSVIPWGPEIYDEVTLTAAYSLRLSRHHTVPVNML